MHNKLNDYTILEKEYWKSPVRVFSGLTWMILGFLLGILVCMGV